MSNDAILVVDGSGRESILRGSRTELNHPAGVAVGRNGVLYVANSGSSEILEFARRASGNEAPIATITGSGTQLIAPQSLAVDGSGRLYVFDGLQFAAGTNAPHYVRVFAPNSKGNSTPLASYAVPAKCWADSL